jgi:hypothetical protein
LFIDIQIIFKTFLLYFILACFPPLITLFPGPSSFDIPLQFRRSQDFYISAVLKLRCAESLAIKVKWSIFNCTPNCSIQANIDHSINTTLTELFIPARTLTYGVYEMQLTVVMTASSNMVSSNSSYVEINPSGITANLVKFGTSLVSSGQDRELILDPGTYSINPDEIAPFNASVSVDIYILLRRSNFIICQDWTYSYQCKLYDLMNTGKWSTFEESNNSCFSNRQGISILNQSESMHYQFLFR